MGLTGLALVFIVVLIGTANLWPFGPSAPKTSEETLATLGVAPSGEDTAPPPAEPPSVLDTPPIDMPVAPDAPLPIDEDSKLTEI